MATQEPKRRVNLLTVKPDNAQFFRLDYSLIWLGVFFLLGCIVFRYASQKGAEFAALPFGVLLAACWYFLIRKKMFKKNKLPFSGVAFEWASQKWWRLSGATKDYVDDPEVGEIVNAERPASRPKPIKQIGKVQFNAYQIPSGMMGWARDFNYKTYSVTIDCKFSSLLTAGTETQARRLMRFAELLDNVSESNGLLYRLVWRDQTFRGENPELHRNLETIRRGANLTRTENPNQDLVLSNIALKSAEVDHHRTTMTLVFYRPKVDRESKRLKISVEELMARQVASVLANHFGSGKSTSPLGTQGVKVLTYNNLVIENRLAVDPVHGQYLWQEWLPARDESVMLDEQFAWPTNAFFFPGYCQLGETYHRSCYITNFGRRGMPVDQFNKIIMVPARKTITTVFQMLSPDQGMKHAEVSRVAAGSGRIVRVRDQQEADDALAFEHEVASLQGRVGRVRTYIDLWGSTLEEVLASQSLIENACTDSRYKFEFLDGRQHLGVSAAMPIGRGLASPTGRLEAPLRWLGM